MQRYDVLSKNTCLIKTHFFLAEHVEVDKIREFGLANLCNSIRELDTTIPSLRATRGNLSFFFINQLFHARSIRYKERDLQLF